MEQSLGPLKLPRIAAASATVLNRGEPLARVIDRLAAANAAAAAEVVAAATTAAAAAIATAGAGASVAARRGDGLLLPPPATGDGVGLPRWMTAPLGRPVPPVPVLPSTHTLVPAGLAWRVLPPRGGVGTGPLAGGRGAAGLAAASCRATATAWILPHLTEWGLRVAKMGPAGEGGWARAAQAAAAAAAAALLVLALLG
ncbi:hypothetical protein MMPV_002537 [Pyropia vietnamensis]